MIQAGPKPNFYDARHNNKPQSASYSSMGCTMHTEVPASGVAQFSFFALIIEICIRASSLIYGRRLIKIKRSMHARAILVAMMHD